jgi:hypothetical protein
MTRCHRPKTAAGLPLPPVWLVPLHSLDRLPLNHRRDRHPADPRSRREATFEMPLHHLRRSIHLPQIRRVERRTRQYSSTEKAGQQILKIYTVDIDTLDAVTRSETVLRTGNLRSSALAICGRQRPPMSFSCVPLASVIRACRQVPVVAVRSIMLPLADRQNVRNTRPRWWAPCLASFFVELSLREAQNSTTD